MYECVCFGRLVEPDFWTVVLTLLEVSLIRLKCEPWHFLVNLQRRVQPCLRDLKQMGGSYCFVVICLCYGGAPELFLLAVRIDWSVSACILA